jgi:hypothetical protein
MEQTAYRWGYGRKRGHKRHRASKREWITERALNSGVFVNLPNPELSDEVWASEVEVRIRHARKVLLEFRELLRAGKPLPDEQEEALERARATINRFMKRFGDPP